MKRISTRDKELLSAYLDDELSFTEREMLERRLKTSPELQAELKRLSNLRNRIAGIDPLPADPWFETRLMERIATDKKAPLSFIMRYSPAIGFAALSVVLMIVFAVQPTFLDDVYNTQRDSIEEFYQANLLPMLGGSDLTNADIFNFAWNEVLPLDNENSTVLNLGTADVSKAFFELRDSREEPAGMNYTEFVNAMEFDDAEREAVDSILESYKDEILTAVMYRPDSKGIAVKKNIINYQAALRAELIDFAAKKRPGLVRAMPVAWVENNNEDLLSFTRAVKNSQENDYVCISADSIYSFSFELDSAAMAEVMVEIERGMQENAEAMRELRAERSREMKRLRESMRSRSPRVDPPYVGKPAKAERPPHVQVAGHGIQFDTRDGRVIVPNIPDYDFVMPNMDSIRFAIDVAMDVLDDMSISIEVDSSSDGTVRSFAFDIRTGPDSSMRNFQYNYKLPDKAFFDSLNTAIQVFQHDSVIQKFIPKFQMKGNQLKMDMESFFNDSTMQQFMQGFGAPDSFLKNFEHFRPAGDAEMSRELQEEMEDLQEEMRQLREEMRQLRREQREERERERKN